jgi:hypothetical protein
VKQVAECQRERHRGADHQLGFAPAQCRGGLAIADARNSRRSVAAATLPVQQSNVSWLYKGLWLSLRPTRAAGAPDMAVREPCAREKAPFSHADRSAKPSSASICPIFSS